MGSARWKTVFKEFFISKVPMTSSYKPVLLYALVDAAYYCDGKKPIGHKWINFEGSKIRLDLNFIAARFALYYWEVYPLVFRHMAQEGSGKGGTKYDPEIMKIIRKRFKTREIPDLKELEGDGMQKLRRDIIRDAITPHVLPNLLKNMRGLYVYKRGDNYITFDTDLAEYMNSDPEKLKGLIQRKLDEYIKSRNRKPMSILPVENPFYLYVKNRFKNAQSKLRQS
ncbi:hypothetical protein IBTHAUMO2_410011 [Nitrosopumilaceae archaeon]|nr:hypothetical protein [Nitrosopumilus sp.]CAI9831764.1 hypothetical protein IBTHAUMO2_410011 [Nitrosopumilaceae archaeon]MDA7944413.1 hypothetical protein [Nitrosopumilus sp.]MDA7954165.1 hypothetical protein [Nitrosopumilus sp.]MDA7973239.1 hypothetical protein [Nitrosopumilus sp.]